MKSLLVAVAVTFLLLGVLWWQSDRRADDLDARADALAEDRAAQAAVIEELAGSVVVLRDQVTEEGLRPVAPPPDVTIREGRIGATGATGSTGAQGTAGRDGRDGVDGVTPACWFEQSQCVGPTGPKGDKGDTGPAGADGDDSTVPGPQGPAGSNGSDGAPGPACPAGYEPRVMETGPYQGWIACAPTGAP